MKISNCGGNGIYLGEETMFEGYNLEVVNCRSGLYVDKTKVSIDGLKVDGKERQSVGIRVESDCELNNFEVTGLLPDYPIWVTGKNCKFINGKIYNNAGPYGFIIHEKADNIYIENVEMFDDRPIPQQTRGFMVIQKSGSLTIKNNSLRNQPKIENRTGIRILDY